MKKQVNVFLEVSPIVIDLLASLVRTQLDKFILRLDRMILHFGKIYMTKMPLILAE